MLVLRVCNKSIIRMFDANIGVLGFWGLRLDPPLDHRLPAVVLVAKPGLARSVGGKAA